MVNENTGLVIKRADINSDEARILIDELSAELQTITGNSGRASFHDADINNPRSLFVVAMEQDVAVGCGAFREISDDTAEIKRMYAKKKSVGVGGKILAYLEEQAKEFGYSKVVLETRKCNEKAVSFYQRHGYGVIKNYGKYVEMPEAVCFEKILK
jgi:Acetyltransferases